MREDKRPESAGRSSSQGSIQHGANKQGLGFEWLSRAYRGSTYISYTELANRTASAFDFGDNGYAAACNYGGELLQISAPSKVHGIVFARGDFEYSLYSSLARGQRSPGGKSAFGLKIDSRTSSAQAQLGSQPTSSGNKRIALGPMLERGSFNYRWPVNEYILRVDDGNNPPGIPPQTTIQADMHSISEESKIGTCSFVSFAGDGFVYQLLNLDLRGDHLDEHADSHIVLNIGGTINFKGLVPAVAPSPTESPQAKTRSTTDMKEGTRARFSLPGMGIMLEAQVFLVPDGEKPAKPEALKLTKLHTSTSPLDPDPGPSGKEDNASSPYEARITLGDARKKYKNDKRVTFVAVFSLHDRGDKLEFSPWPSDTNDLLLDPQKIYHHLGLCRDCDMATGTMWETAFLEKDEESYAVSELSEVSLVGRCLEKTLQVDLVPVTFDKSGKPEEDGPVAIVSNLFLKANVDLKALFWKLRFLVKVRSMLRYVTTLERDKGVLCTGEDFVEEEKIMIRVAKAQIKRVELAVERVVLYLACSMLDPANSEHATKKIKLLPDNHIRAESNYYYVMMSIWYAVRNYKEHPLTGEFTFPEFPDKLSNTIAEWHKGKGLLDSPNCLPSEDWIFPKDQKAKAALLKWFHYASVNGLANAGILQPGTYDWATSETEELHVFVERLKRKAKMALATRISAQPIYSDDEEIVDRLAFVASELGAESHSPIKHNSSGPAAPARRICVSDLVTKRILQRDYSRVLYPGLLSHDQEGPMSGPWEIHALCHHSRLMVANANYKIKLQQDMQDDERARMRAEVERYRGKFSKFLTSDATLVPCWDRTNLIARRGWLRSEASSVLAYTLIEICLKDLKYTFDERIRVARQTSPPSQGEAPSPKLPAVQPSRERWSANAEPSVGLTKSLTERTSATVLGSGSPEAALIRDFLKRRMEEMDKGEDSPNPPLDWRLYSPPCKYHPEEFFNSLDDTPELFRKANTSKVALPIGLQEYFFNEQNQSVQGPSPHMGARDDNPAQGMSRHNGLGEQEQAPDYDDFEKWIRSPENLVAVSVIDLTSTAAKGGTSRIHATGFSGIKYAGPVKNAPSIPSITRLNRNPCSVGSEVDTELCNMLGDSLVDQEVQHRVIALTSISSAKNARSKTQLQLLAYVLHPESIDCLNSHILRVSEFSCQKQDAWVARITLRSWSRQELSQIGSAASPVPVNKTGLDRFLSVEDDLITLPHHLEEPLRAVNNLSFDPTTSHCVDLKISSITLSSNAFGDFSKCSIISEIIPPDKLKKLGEDARELWQKFTYQPQTGRCLIFLMTLGLLCQEIARESRDAMDYFVRILDLDAIFIRNAEDWGEQEDPIGQLKLGLWCLESLYKLRNTLVGSMARIQEAKDALLIQIQDGPGKRSESLERMCQEYLDLFDRSLAELAAINSKLERKVELNTRYRDSLSSVFTLIDSRASIAQNNRSIEQNDRSIEQNNRSIKQNALSIRQNRTIERLTFLTIGYLPLSLTAAIFAIPDNQNVTPDGMGTPWFTGIIFLMLLVTLVISLFIETLKELWSYGVDRPVRRVAHKVFPKWFKAPDEKNMLASSASSTALSRTTSGAQPRAGGPAPGGLAARSQTAPLPTSQPHGQAWRPQMHAASVHAAPGRSSTLVRHWGGLPPTRREPDAAQAAAPSSSHQQQQRQTGGHQRPAPLMEGSTVVVVGGGGEDGPVGGERRGQLYEHGSGHVYQNGMNGKHGDDEEKGVEAASSSAADHSDRGGGQRPTRVQFSPSAAQPVALERRSSSWVQGWLGWLGHGRERHSSENP